MNAHGKSALARGCITCLREQPKENLPDQELICFSQEHLSDRFRVQMIKLT